MKKLECFKQFSEIMPMQEKAVLYQHFVGSPKVCINNMITLAPSHNLVLKQSKVSELIKSINDEEKLKDIALNDVVFPEISDGSVSRHGIVLAV